MHLNLNTHMHTTLQKHIDVYLCECIVTSLEAGLGWSCRHYRSSFPARWSPWKWSKVPRFVPSSTWHTLWMVSKSCTSWKLWYTNIYKNFLNPQYLQYLHFFFRILPIISNDHPLIQWMEYLGDHSNGAHMGSSHHGNMADMACFRGGNWLKVGICMFSLRGANFEQPDNKYIKISLKFVTMPRYLNSSASFS